MALEDPYDPRAPLDPYGMQTFDQVPPPLAAPSPEQVAAAEYGTPGIPTIPPPPPPPQAPPPTGSTLGPRGRNSLAAQGQPTGDEVPYGAVPPPLTPEEEAQIHIDQPAPPQLGELPPEYVGTGAPPELAALQHELHPDILQAPPDAITGENAAPPSDTPVRNAGEDITNDYLAHPEKIGADAVQADLEAKRQYREKYLADLDQQQKDRTADFQAHQAAMAQGAKMAQDIANTKIDPEGWWHSRSTAQKIAGVVSAFLGGLGMLQNGGRNIAMEQINKAIDNDMQAQQENLANRRSALGDFYRQTGDMYTAQQAYRAGIWNNVVEKLQTEEQNYDPQGTIYRGIAAQKLQAQAQVQMAAQAGAQQKYKNTMDGYKTSAEVAEKLAAARKSDAETKKILGQVGGAGAGAGSGTNPNYTVASGFFDPFTNEPVMGKRALGGKGGDSKEPDAVSQQLQTYKHVNDTLTKMKAIAQELGGGGKGVEESIWKGRKTTLASDYDAAREELTSYLTKAIGDRPTQGQLELQAHRIPERKSLFEAADPVKLLDSQFDAADRAFKADLDVPGVNAAPIIAHARAARVIAPQPQSADQLSSATDAVGQARTPAERKNAEKALDAAKQRVEAEAADKLDTANAIKQVDGLAPVTLMVPSVFESEQAEGDPHTASTPKKIADADAFNEAARAYNARLAKYAELHSAKKPNPDAVGLAARKLLDAKHAMDTARATFDAHGYIDTSFHP